MSETTTTTDRTATDDNSGWISAVVALLGGWLVASAFVYGDAISAANFWNNIIVGAAIGVIAGYNALKTDDYETINTGAASLVALLGVWMVVAPFVFDAVNDAVFWSDVVTGALVAVLAGYNAYYARSVDRRTRTAEAETR